MMRWTLFASLIFAAVMSIQGNLTLARKEFHKSGSLIQLMDNFQKIGHSVGDTVQEIVEFPGRLVISAMKTVMPNHKVSNGNNGNIPSPNDKLDARRDGKDTKEEVKSSSDALNDDKNVIEQKDTMAEVMTNSKVLNDTKNVTEQMKKLNANSDALNDEKDVTEREEVKSDSEVPNVDEDVTEQNKESKSEVKSNSEVPIDDEDVKEQDKDTEAEVKSNSEVPSKF